VARRGDDDGRLIGRNDVERIAGPIVARPVFGEQNQIRAKPDQMPLVKLPEFAGLIDTGTAGPV
jgi:hypothetical protein